MLEDIVKVLNSSKASAWELTDTRTDGWEFYFIRHELDQNRAKQVEHISLTVYIESADAQFMGNASDEIDPTDTVDEIKEKVDRLIKTASFVKNKPFALHGPKTEKPERLVSDLAEISSSFIKAMKTTAETESEDINSYEIFVNDINCRYLNSNGVDITQTYPKSMVEVVVNARKAEHEIELYRMYESGTCDEAGLKHAIAKTLQYGKDRLDAVKTPELGKMPVIFSTADSTAIYDYFIDRLNTAYIYRQFSDWKIGEVIAEDIRGDKVTVKTVRQLENSSQNLTYDHEGGLIREITLMENAVPQSYWGNRMFASYLGLDDAFLISNCIVSGGTKSEAELRQGDYLEVVEFSDFQVDPVTGNVFGEIRLGYLHQNGEVKVVSGGSLSGNMEDYEKELYLSAESVQYDHIVVPTVTRIENVTVTAAE